MSLMQMFLYSALVFQTGDDVIAVDEGDAVNEVDAFQFTYVPVGKRDPFEPFVIRGKVEGTSDNPLFNFDLNQFQLTGVVWGMANPRAIIRDPDGRGHIIRRGTRMGRQRGRVMRILRDRIVIAESYRDNLGKLMVKEVSLELSDEGKGAR